MILAGDVGGTKTALALFDERGRGQALVRESVTASHGYAAPEQAIRQFLLEGPPVTIDAACVGVAGPVIDGRCTAINLPWVVDEAALAQSAGTSRMKLVNDLEATAHGVLGLGPSALARLQAGKPHKANMALIAAGTGLGEVVLPWDGRRHHTVPSEGGHVDFAPRNDLEIDLWKFLRREFGRVSYERVVSGPGLYNIYRFLVASDGTPEPEWLRARMESGDPSAAVSEAALERRDPRSVQALEVFVSVYGAEAGNLALKYCATAGLWLGGSIAESLLNLFRGDVFLNAFSTHGPPRIREMLAKIPIHLIKFELNGLYGAANYAASL